jgi:hypothetical protein
MDDSTGDPNAFSTTVTETGGGGNSTIVKATTVGQLFLLTTDNADYDGLNVQLKGEPFKLETNKPLYFGCKLEINDVDQTDLLIGLAETETTLMATASAHATAIAGDALAYVSIDGAATITMEGHLDGSETNTATASATLADDTAIVFEFYWDGETVYGYINDSLVGTFSSSLPDGDMTVSINFRTGETTANTCKIHWLRCIQCR